MAALHLKGTPNPTSEEHGPFLNLSAAARAPVEIFLRQSPKESRHIAAWFYPPSSIVNQP
jgi:hypothetical protein